MFDFVVDRVSLFFFRWILFIWFCIPSIICFEEASGSPVLKYISWSECTDAGLTGKLPGCSLQFVDGLQILCNNVFNFPWYAICFEWASGGPVLNYIGWSECTDAGLTGKVPGCSLQFAEWVWLLLAIESFWFKYPIIRNMFWMNFRQSCVEIHWLVWVYRRRFDRDTAWLFIAVCWWVAIFFAMMFSVSHGTEYVLNELQAVLCWN